MLKNVVYTLVIITCLCSQAWSQPQSDLREEENIYEQIYNAPLKLIDGKSTTVLQLAEKKPLILALIFTRCSGICSPYLLQLKENIKSQSADATKPFNVLVLSFDSEDSVADMVNLAKRFELLDDNNWHFAITDSITGLIKSVGFHPVWNDNIKQFDHDALLVGINTQGFIIKKLLGMRGESDVALLIESINNEFIPTYRLPGKSSLFSCFNYDPKTGKNTPGLGLLFIALPALIAMLLLFGIRFVVRSKSS